MKTPHWELQSHMREVAMQSQVGRFLRETGPNGGNTLVTTLPSERTGLLLLLLHHERQSSPMTARGIYIQKTTGLINTSTASPRQVELL